MKSYVYKIKSNVILEKGTSGILWIWNRWYLFCLLVKNTEDKKFLSAHSNTLMSAFQWDLKN